METVILCGGKGTRAYPHTLELPKPLLEVGDVPILEHVLDIYRAQGFDRFVLAAGYKHELVAEFARGQQGHIVVRDTGEETGTGARIRACEADLPATFFATYADGLGNVDLRALLAFHRGHGGAATVTTVPLPSPYGTIECGPDGRVDRFREKPMIPGHRINAGFFVFERRALGLWEGDDLEREVLPALARHGELFAYEHHGFWRSMDTYKEALELGELCERDAPPWLDVPGAPDQPAGDDPGLPAS